MSKSASIAEGDISRKFVPVDKVKVHNSSTEEAAWIPEDAKPVRSLNVTKNGIYYAVNDGYAAYDQVTVNVSSETDISIENVLSDLGIGDLSEIGDLDSIGIYDLADLENVALEELQDLAELTDEDLKDIEDAALTNGTDKIKGIDPDTGDVREFSKKADGTLVESNLPTGISIAAPPYRTVYLDGETIEFAGIKVYAMCNSGVYTSPEYPTGAIPFSELYFPHTTAFAGGGHQKYAKYGSDSWPVYDGLSGDIPAGGGFVRVEFTVTSSNPITAINDYVILGASKTPDITATHTRLVYHSSVPEIHESELFNGSLYSATFYGKTAYYKKNIIFRYSPGAPGGNEEWVAWLLVYGKIEVEDTEEVPVDWQGFEDSFTITYGEGGGGGGGGDDGGGSDPFVGYSDVTYNGHFYNINRKLVPQIHYANGYVWQEGISTEYTTQQAIDMGWLIRLR